MATIKDIAELAGVSPSTVSRALNKSPLIPATTRKKILAVAQQMNYKPNRNARKLVLKSNDEKVAGIVFPDVIHNFYYEVLKGINEKLLEAHYNLMVFNMIQERKRFFSRIINYDLSALFLLGCAPLTFSEKKLLRENGIPCIYLDYYDKGSDCVYCDNELGGRLAARYLLEKGAENIAYIGISNESIQQDQRFMGFKKELTGNSSRIKYIKYASKVEEEAYFVTAQLLEANPGIDGIFYFCDELAYGGTRAVAEYNLPISIVGFDDLYPSRFVPLTTVKQPAYQMGYKGTELLLQSLHSPGGRKPAAVRLQPELIIRN